MKAQALQGLSHQCPLRQERFALILKGSFIHTTTPTGQMRSVGMRCCVAPSVFHLLFHPGLIAKRKLRCHGNAASRSELQTQRKDTVCTRGKLHRKRNGRVC